MARNINNVQYALMPTGGAQQQPPVGQTYSHGLLMRYVLG